jgi:FAD/FMN-containing dehydrogenase
VPEFLRGKSVVMVRGCYAGDTAAGEKLLKHWRTWQAPLADLWGEIPFTRMGEISADPVDPMPSNHTGAWMNNLSDAAIDTLIHYAFPAGVPPPLIMVEARHFGGAVARVLPETNAFSHRNAAFLQFAVTAAFKPEISSAQTAHMDAMLNDLEPVLTGGVYLNFMEGLAARKRAKDGFSPGTYQRLQALKAQVDPENCFRFGYHIPPAIGI